MASAIESLFSGYTTTATEQVAEQIVQDYLKQILGYRTNLNWTRWTNDSRELLEGFINKHTSNTSSYVRGTISRQVNKALSQIGRGGLTPLIMINLECAPSMNQSAEEKCQPDII